MARLLLIAASCIVLLLFLAFQAVEHYVNAGLPVGGG